MRALLSSGIRDNDEYAKKEDERESDGNSSDESTYQGTKISKSLNLKMEVLSDIKQCSPIENKEIFVEFLEKTKQSVKNLKSLSVIIKNASNRKLDQKDSMLTDVENNNDCASIAAPVMSTQVIAPSNEPVDEDMFDNKDILNELMDSQRSRT
jgi:hypothetical protein